MKSLLSLWGNKLDILLENEELSMLFEVGSNQPVNNIGVLAGVGIFLIKPANSVIVARGGFTA